MRANSAPPLVRTAQAQPDPDAAPSGTIDQNYPPNGTRSGSSKRSPTLRAQSWNRSRRHPERLCGWFFWIPGVTLSACSKSGFRVTRYGLASFLSIRPVMPENFEPALVPLAQIKRLPAPPSYEFLGNYPTRQNAAGKLAPGFGVESLDKELS